ncbi:MAG: porin family protein [Pseudomonadota bacterium]
MNYRELILSAGIIVALCLPADAQERWTGYYFGVSIDRADTSVEVPGNSTHSLSDKGTNFGLYAGYGIRGRNNFVWTPEIMLSSLDTVGTASDAALGSTGFHGSFLLAPRVRGGFATERAYFYGVIGLGITDVRIRPIGNSDTDFMASFGTGLGAEFALDDKWSTRIEAMHYMWEPQQILNGVERDTETEATIFRIGLTRRF